MIIKLVKLIENTKRLCYLFLNLNTWLNKPKIVKYASLRVKELNFFFLLGKSINLITYHVTVAHEIGAHLLFFKCIYYFPVL